MIRISIALALLVSICASTAISAAFSKIENAFHYADRGVE